MPKLFLTEERDKKAFRSIVYLYRHAETIFKENQLSGVQVSEDCIRYGNSEYYLGDDREAKKSEFVAKMGDRGASWFETIRGTATTNTAASQWKTLVTSVNEQFYRKYSCLLYKDGEDITERQREKYKKKIKRFLSLSFNLQENDIHIDGNSQKQSSETIFAIGVRMEVTDVGQPKPYLGKFFFTVTEEGIVALKGKIAEELNGRLSRFDSGTVGNGVLSQSETVDTASTILCIQEYLKQDNIDVSSFFVCNQADKDADKDDENFRKKMKEDGGTDFSCTNLSINSLIILKQNVVCFDVYIGNSTVAKFSAKVDTLGNVTVDCKTCGQEKIISNSSIVFVDEDKREHEICLLLSGEKCNVCDGADSYSLDKDDGRQLLEMVQRYLISQHMNKVDRETCCANASCGQRYVCTKNSTQVLIGYDANKQEILQAKCSDCPYLENYVFVERKDKEPIAVSLRYGGLYYDYNNKTFSLNNKKTCRHCGRSISSGNYCDLCRKLEEPTGTGKEQRDLFRKYAYMVPVLQRLRIGTIKQCVEDEGMIVFRIGQNYWYFDKTKMEGEGFLRLEKVKKQ